jgi:hypothetical protein
MFRSSDNNIPHESGFDKSNVGREWEREENTPAAKVNLLQGYSFKQDVII